jgi:acetoin utilization deacetylase AcuC-like enzyme
MTLLYSHPLFEQHETGRHPEQPARLRAVLEELSAAGLTSQCVQPEWLPATPAELGRLHGAEYIAHLERFCQRGGGQLDADTVVSEQSYAAAALAAGAVQDAVRRVVTGEASTAFVACRPPGHHALADSAMGFCLLGNVALGAKLAIEELKLDRVLVVDWDVHHGNGTQDFFYTDEQVGFFSAHRYPFWPGSGAADETGSGAGLGATHNLPLAFGTSRDRILSQFARELGDFADRIKPQLVLVSAGFDAHRLDPIGSLGLETEDFAYLTAAVLDIAAAHAGGRVVSVLEGGYHLEALAASSTLHVQELLDRESEFKSRRDSGACLTPLPPHQYPAQATGEG